MAGLSTPAGTVTQHL